MQITNMIIGSNDIKTFNDKDDNYHLPVTQTKNLKNKPETKSKPLAKELVFNLGAANTKEEYMVIEDTIFQKIKIVLCELF